MTENHALAQKALAAVEHGILITDPQGVIVAVNPALSTMTGFSEQQLVGARPSLFNSGAMPREYFQRLWTTISSGRVWKEEIENRRADGSLYYASQIISPVVDPDGAITAYVAIQHDVTANRQLREELQAIFINTQDALFLLNVEAGGQLRFVKVNPEMERLTGLTSEEIRGKSPAEAFPDQAAQVMGDRYRQCLATAAPSEYEETLSLPGGTRHWNTRLYPVIEEGNVTQIVGCSRDISERKQMEEELRYLSEMDTLTGVANRRKTWEELEREVSRAQRHRHAASVLMVDIDHFKTINDNFGHETGDAVLRGVTTIAAATLRPADRLGRWGGEEFLVILPETPKTGAGILAERLRSAIAGSRLVRDHAVTVSIGISTLPDEVNVSDPVEIVAQELLRRADANLYRAKEAGRNRVYDSDSDNR